MTRSADVWSAWTAGLAVVLAAASVEAQEVRRYGDEGGSSSDSSGGGGGGGSEQSRPYYPGQPMPESNQGGDQTTTRTRRQKQSEGKEETEDAPRESYSIRIHEPDDVPKAERKTTEAPLNKPPEKMYQGVVPGERDTVKHLEEERRSAESPSKPNKITWIGFQPTDDKTRVFVQTAREPDYTRERSDRRTIEIRLRNTEISTQNFRRHIDTSEFGRVVERIEAVDEEDEAVVRIDLRSSTAPSFEISKTYLYIDFPHPADEDAEDPAEEEQ